VGAMTSLFDALNSVRWMITRASIPDKVKVELLNWLCGDIIEAIHDLDHATRHFTANKTKETFKQFWLRLEQIEKRHRERLEGEPEHEEWDLKRLLGK